MKNIFEETTLRGYNIKNRIIRSATWEALADQKGHLTNDLFEVYEDLAQGDIGIIITGMVSVASNDNPVPFLPGLYDECFIDENRKLTDMVKGYGSLIIPQISLDGYNCYSKNSSSLDPTSLSLEGIYQIVRDFAKAAKIAKLSGYDGVQLHAAHGWFLSRFISPLFNKRTDKYGGTPINRSRILSDIYYKIRAELGDDFLITIKINSEDFQDGGLTQIESLLICQQLSKIGIDAIEVSGNYTSRTKINTAKDEAYFFPFAKELAASVDTSIILVGGHRSIENMNRVLNTSNVDFLSISRPFIRESNLLTRWKKGNLASAKCISCNACYRTDGHKCVFLDYDRRNKQF